jgi:hypothetical protein
MTPPVLPGPRHMTSKLRFKSAKKQYRFSGSFKIEFSAIFISVAVQSYHNIKIENTVVVVTQMKIKCGYPLN